MHIEQHRNLFVVVFAVVVASDFNGEGGGGGSLLSLLLYTVFCLVFPFLILTIRLFRV